MTVRYQNPLHTTGSQVSPRRTTSAVSLTLALFAFAGAANADTVNLAHAGPTYGRVVQASIGSASWNITAGRLGHTTSGGTGQMVGLPQNIVTFCVDLLQAPPAASGSFTRSSIATLSGNTGLTNLGFARQQAIYDLYQAAANRQFTLGLDYATAFQVAIWEVVYDYNAALPNHGLSVTNGTFRATAPGQASLSASITSKVQFLLASVGMGAGSHGLVGLRSGAYQDQLFSPEGIVPLPAAAWIGFAGLGLAAASRLRRRPV